MAAQSQLSTLNFQLIRPLSCRWRSDWHPCHPSLTNGSIRDHRFHFVLYSQTSGQECVLQRATFAAVRDMRRRWRLSLNWKPSYRRLFNAHSARRHAHPIEQHPSIERVEPLTSHGEYSFRRNDVYSLRSSWLTGDFIPIENRKPRLTPTELPGQLRSTCMSMRRRPSNPIR